MAQAAKQASLYEQDLNLWLEDTIAQLKAGNLHNLDTQHLIEELEDLAGRDRRELRSRSKVLLEHLLKRCYVDSAYDNRNWEITIRNERDKILDILEDSPSLRGYLLEVFDGIYQKALGRVREDYPKNQFPDACPFPSDINAILSQPLWDK